MSAVAPSSSVSWWQRLRGHLTLDLTPLRESRDYRLLFTGQFVSAFGSAITYVILPWQMYELTHSTFDVGLLGLAEFFPMFFLSFAGGALADTVDRRKLILIAECGLGLCCAALTVNALQATPYVWVLFVGAAWSAGFNAIHRPALESLTPQLVLPKHLPAVSALASLRSFMFVVGPAIAGMIAATFGAAMGFGINFCTYIVAFFAVLGLRGVPAPQGVARMKFSLVVEGLRYAKSRGELLGTYLIDINAMFFAMPIVLFPALAQTFGHVSVGWFYSTFALGPLLVSLTSGWTGRVQRHGRAIVLAVIVWGLAIVGFALAHSLWLALGFLLLAGAADGVSGIFRMTIWNQSIPDRLRGRMASVEMLSYLTGPYLGNAQVGFSASLLGLHAGIAGGGLACVLGTVLLATLLPRFYRYHSADGIAHKEANSAGV